MSPQGTVFIKKRDGCFAASHKIYVFEHGPQNVLNNAVFLNNAASPGNNLGVNGLTYLL